MSGNRACTNDRFFLGCLIVLGLCSIGAAVEPGFYPLGDLPRTAFWSEAEGVSPDGSITVGAGDIQASNPSLPISEAFFCAPGSPMQGLGDITGGYYRSRAFAVSAAGAVIVGFGTASDNSNRACVWTVGQGVTVLPRLPGAVYGATAYDVTPDGSVVVGASSSAPGMQAFRWTAQTGVEGLGDLAGKDFSSYAYAVSADGSVVVGEGCSDRGTTINGQEAFIWRSDTRQMVGLGFLPGSVQWSVAHDVTADGRVVVGVSESEAGVEGFYWTEEGGMMGIGFTGPGFERSTAEGVSADGRVIVGTTLVQDRLIDAAVWDLEHGLRHLATILAQDFGFNMTGWRLIDARDVSDDGLTIVGRASDSSNKVQAYLVRLPVGAWCHVPFADIDGDGDADQTDFGYLQRCVTGMDDPDGTFDETVCRCFDVDSDEDIDADDVEAFQRCLSGSGFPADPACAD